MKKLNLNKLISFVLVCVMLMSTFVITSYADGADDNAPAEIVSENVYYGDTLKFMFAVKADEDVEYTLEVTDESGVALPVEAFTIGETDEQVEAKGGLVWITKIGIPAQHIAKKVNVAVKVGEETVDAMSYSVLEYLYTRLYVNTDATAVQKNLYNTLLAYGIAADADLNPDADYSVADYKMVNCVNCYVVDGEAKDIYTNDQTLAIATDLVANDEFAVVYKVTNFDKGTTVKYTAEEMADGLDVTGNITIEAELEEISAPKEPVLLATFELGANGSASHYDGKDMGASKSFTDSGYTLALTGCSKIYYDARDAKGNSCLKFGASSAAGSITFTVPENVTSVEIAVAKYKSNATKVTINGGAAQTLTKNSNDGQYDIITVDTSTTKTITIATASGGYRMMMNYIKFTGYAD